MHTRIHGEKYLNCNTLAVYKVHQRANQYYLGMADSFTKCFLKRK